jgi:HEAT repeat protein
MNFKFLTYGFVLSMLAVAVFIDRSDKEVKSSTEYSSKAEVVTSSNLNRQAAHPRAFGSDRSGNESAGLFIKSDTFTVSSPLYQDTYNIDFVQGDVLERGIRDMLNDLAPENRMAALQEVYRLDESVAIRLLHEVLLKERNGIVVQKAAVVLTDIAGEESVAMVTTALGNSDVTARRQSIEALGLVGVYGYSLLGQALLADPDITIRLRALQLLAADGSSAAMALLEAVAEDADPAVSRAAKQALTSQQASLNGWLIEDVSETLYSWSTELPFDPENPIFSLSPDSLPDERTEALWNLQYINEGDALQTLQVVLQQDRDVSVREEALAVLDSIGGKLAFSIISTAVGDDSSVLRHAALESLWKYNTSDRLPIVGQVMFGDPNPTMRLEAVRLLGSESNPVARSFLIAAREDPDERVRQYADRLLGQ